MNGMAPKVAKASHSKTAHLSKKQPITNAKPIKTTERHSTTLVATLLSSQSSAIKRNIPEAIDANPSTTHM